MATVNKPLVLDETLQALNTLISEKTFGLPVLQDKTIVANGTYSCESGFDGIDTVYVNVPTPTPTLQVKTALTNGDVTPDSGYDGISKVTVNVPTGPNAESEAF